MNKPNFRFPASIIFRIATSAVLLGVLTAPASAQDATITELRGLLPDIGVKAIDERASAQKRWEELTYELGRPGNDQRSDVCKAMVTMLAEPKTRPAAKQFIILQLQRVGGEEVVPALSGLLNAEQSGISDAARRALANNPSAAAGKALMDGFTQSAEKTEQRKLMNAIGFRRDAASTDFLLKVLTDPDSTSKRAAADALSTFADKDTVALVRKAGNRDALLRLADQLAANGNKKTALAIYRPIAKNTQKAKLPGRLAGMAAYRGLLDNVGNNKVVELVTEGLTGEDKLRRQVAMARIRSLGAAQVDELGATLSELPTPAQVAVLTAIGTRSIPAGKKAVLAATKSDDSEVRLVAIQALRRVGDASDLPQLMKWLGSDGEEQDAARTVLQRMRDESLNNQLAAQYETNSDAATRGQLLDILNNRRATSALPIFVAALQDKDANTRQRAFGAISRLGTANEVGSMVAAAIATADGERDKAEKQIVQLCRRIPEGATPVVTFFDSADAKTQSQLMPLLGRIGDAKSLTTIRTALNGKNAEQNQAAVTALANWPNHQVASDLKSIAESTKDSGQRIRALRGLARVCVLGGADGEKLDYLKFVLESATRADEKVLALDRARSIRTLDSLNFVLPHIEDDDLGPRACQTVIDLAHHRGLREENRSAFEPALKKVQTLIKDERQLERVRKYLANE